MINLLSLIYVTLVQVYIEIFGTMISWSDLLDFGIKRT